MRIEQRHLVEGTGKQIVCYVLETMQHDRVWKPEATVYSVVRGHRLSLVSIIYCPCQVTIYQVPDWLQGTLLVVAGPWAVSYLLVGEDQNKTTCRETQNNLKH